jgi:hypothetical protein
MSSHPVQLHVELPERMARIHLPIRMALLVAVALLGGSALYLTAYVALPAIAALFLLRGGAERYLGDGAGPLVLEWVARVYAYLWLLSDELPAKTAQVQLAVAPGGQPTARSALLRWVTSFPALILLLLLSLVAVFVWVLAAVIILSRGRPSASASDFLAATLRFQLRLLAYHLSLTDRYPSLQREAALPAAAAHA